MFQIFEIIHLLNADGNEDFKFLMFVATDVVGIVFRLYVLLNGISVGSSSLFFIRITFFSGLGMYSGNFANEQFQPLRGGFVGLNATS